MRDDGFASLQGSEETEISKSFLVGLPELCGRISWTRREGTLS